MWNRGDNRAQRRPDGPRGSILTGNLRAYDEDRLGFLLRAREDYGGLVTFDSRTTIVNDVDLADRLLRDVTGTFDINHNVLGHRLSVSDVASIMNVRPVLNPGLRPAALVDVPHHVASLVRTQLGPTRAGRTFDPAAFAEQVIPRAFAWRLFGAGTSPFADQVARLLDALEEAIGNVLTPPATWRFPAQRRIDARHAELQRDVCGFLDAHCQGNPEHSPWSPPTLIASLLTHEPRHTTVELADLLIGAMLAAQRVPAAAAGWLLSMVADRPGLQAALRPEAAEFMRAVNSQAAATITQYPIALSVVLETLRLYPPTWLITRTTTRSARLGDYSFEADHNFMFSPYVLHRDETLYEQAPRFMPERWQTSPPPPTSFMSFGRGRHRCPGTDFTTSALVALLLTMLDTHQLEQTGRVVPDPRTTLKPRGALIYLTKHAPAREAGRSGATWDRREASAAVVR